MIDLERRISGDWIALKEKLNDLYALLDAFGITASELRAESGHLRLSVESGIVEYKRSRLAPVLSGLETARFRTLSLEEIARLTGAPPETIKSRLRYAYRRLRAALEDLQ